MMTYLLLDKDGSSDRIGNLDISKYSNVLLNVLEPSRAQMLCGCVDLSDDVLLRRDDYLYIQHFNGAGAEMSLFV